MNARTPLTVVAAGTLALVAACGAPPDRSADEATPHGYVEGAQEEAEAQTRLVYAAVDGDGAYLLDLATGRTVPLGERRDERVSALSTDGRYAYLAPEGDRGVRVLDTGVWTRPHGDHSHYYRTDPGEVGALRGAGPGHVHGSVSGTAVVLDDDGEVAVLDREALDDGEVRRRSVLDVGAHHGAALSHRQHVVASVAPDRGDGLPEQVRVFDPDGDEVATIDEPCPELHGQALTRTGAVFACADGALLVTEEDGTFAGERIPYPEGTDAADRAWSLQVRPGSNSVAAIAGEAGVWLLDPSERRWSLIETDEAPVAVASPGDEATVLLLRRDGVLESRDVTDGRVLAERPVLSAPVDPGADPGADPGPTIQVDVTRAYVNDAAGGRILEIDYGDSLRVARTFPTEVAPDLMIESGL